MFRVSRILRRAGLKAEASSSTPGTIPEKLTLRFNTPTKALFADAKVKMVQIPAQSGEMVSACCCVCVLFIGDAVCVCVCVCVCVRTCVCVCVFERVCVIFFLRACVVFVDFAPMPPRPPPKTNRVSSPATFRRLRS